MPLTPDGRIGEPFSQVRAVRELPNGRVLVTDQNEKRIYIADFATKTRTPLGTVGPGPQEYALVLALLAGGRRHHDRGGLWERSDCRTAAERLDRVDQANGNRGDEHPAWVG